MGRGGLLLVVVLAALLLFTGPAVVETIVNGPRIGPKTELGGDGLVAVDPAELAAAADLDVDVYALARALMSEHGWDPENYLVAIGWAIRNKAEERGTTVLRLLTDGAGTAGDGRFGAQNASAGTKYASTQQDPHERHVRVAGYVLSAPPALDPTRGATHFFSPRTQDALAARGESGYVKTAAQVDADWRAPGGLYAAGAVPVVPPGIDPQRLTLYRRLG
jgi:hypothetical protein